MRLAWTYTLDLHRYLTELNLQTNNVTGAHATAEHLCSACGADSRYASLARDAFGKFFFRFPYGASGSAGQSGHSESPVMAATAAFGGAAVAARAPAVPAAAARLNSDLRARRGGGRGDVKAACDRESSIASSSARMNARISIAVWRSDRMAGR